MDDVARLCELEPNDCIYLVMTSTENRWVMNQWLNNLTIIMHKYWHDLCKLLIMGSIEHTHAEWEYPRDKAEAVVCLHKLHTCVV